MIGKPEPLKENLKLNHCFSSQFHLQIQNIGSIDQSAEFVLSQAIHLGYSGLSVTTFPVSSLKNLSGQGISAPT